MSWMIHRNLAKSVGLAGRMSMRPEESIRRRHKKPRVDGLLKCVIPLRRISTRPPCLARLRLLGHLDRHPWPWSRWQRSQRDRCIPVITRPRLHRPCRPMDPHRCLIRRYSRSIISRIYNRIPFLQHREVVPAWIGASRGIGIRIRIYGRVCRVHAERKMGSRWFRRPRVIRY